MSDLLFRDAHDLARLIATRELSAVDLMTETFARIEAVNPSLNAIVSGLSVERALDLARAADASAPQGPLHGLPLGIKDLSNAAGFPTIKGSPLFAKAKPAKRDDIMVARMRAAGALVVGKTNTPEFGLGSNTFNPVFGRTANPWDPSRTCGGSSGGAAVALATGMLPLADGSDMMGSLRNPAGWTGIYGFRPTTGLVPDEPEGDSYLHQLATLGPMGRCPRDIAMLLSVQAGPDPRLPDLVPVPRLSSLDADLAGKRVAWLGDWGGAWPFEAGVLETCEAALKVFDDLGVRVEAIAPPFPAAKLWQSWTTLRSFSIACSTGILYDMPEMRAQLKPDAIWEIERGRGYSAMDLQRASLIRSDWLRTTAKLFADFDAILMPTAQVWPFDGADLWPREIAGRVMDTYHRWMEVVIPVSLLGLPSLAVPAGFGAAGLPIGLQIAGPRGSDLQMLQLGEGWHQAAPWARQRPPETGRLS